MIVGLQIGKEKSVGTPGKNYMELLSRQINEYSLMAAWNSKQIEKIYISTDSKKIEESAPKFKATLIHRPKELATPESLTEDVLLHAYDFICNDIMEKPEMVVLLFANTPTVNLGKLKQGIQIMKDDSSLDSCFSIVKYNMFSPTRAKKLDGNIIEPFYDLHDNNNITSIRDSQGDVYFADFSIQILRPICFENMEYGQLPIKWMGRKTYGLHVDYGFDIDERWQIPVIEHWLREHGFTNKTTPYEK